MFSLSTAARLVVALSLARSIVAEDYLVSRRHQKRFVDDNGNYNISIYYINDVHAHLDEFAAAGTDCVNATKGCFGGYARVKVRSADIRFVTPIVYSLRAACHQLYEAITP